MPGTHPKKRHKGGQYSEEQLRQAILAVSEGATIYRASISFGIPKETLRRKINGNGNEVKCGAGKTTVLTSCEEKLIVEWLKESAKRGFGKSPDHVCEGVRQILNRAGRKVDVFNDNRPGKSWWIFTTSPRHTHG